MPRTARERARAELTSEILDAARRQLADVGAQQLSLRAVAREVGLVSSAVYRYFPSRDDLLTRLIVDAYDCLGARVEAADGACPRDDVRGRWRAACSAIRQWAVDNPHEYALVYGSPVPGYVAPAATIEPASRVSLALLGSVRHAARTGRLSPPGLSPSGRRGLSRELLAQVRGVAGQVAPELTPELMTRVLLAWTQLFGVISFELFGHLVGSADPATPFFEHCVEYHADQLGLGTARASRS